MEPLITPRVPESLSTGLQIDVLVPISYMGLILDGFTDYRNISSVDPRVKMLFALPPTLFCQLDDVDFDPSRDKIISIKVNDCLQTRDFFCYIFSPHANDRGQR